MMYAWSIEKSCEISLMDAVFLLTLKTTMLKVFLKCLNLEMRFVRFVQSTTALRGNGSLLLLHPVPLLNLLNICRFFTLVLSRDVVLTKKVWERIQKTNHYKTASNSFQSKTWKRFGNAVPTRSRPTTLLVLKSASVSVCFRGISRLPSAFVFLRWYELAHISIQVCTFHDGCKQGIDQQIFNRKSISRKITHPQSWKLQAKLTGERLKGWSNSREKTNSRLQSKFRNTSS